MVIAPARSWVILVSARDPGAALALVPVLHHLTELSHVTLHIVAQNPAYETFRRENFNVMLAKSSPLNNVADEGSAELLAEAGGILETLRPDALLAGLSSPGVGIDEALLANAGDIPSYSIQDPPGYIVQGFSGRARTQFVAGSDLIENFDSARCIYIGPSQVERYRNACPSQMAQQWRQTIGCDGVTAVLFGQPLNKEPGYLSSFYAAISALTDLVDPVIDHIVYRAHPKETAEDRAEVLTALTKFAGREVLEDPLALRVEGALCGCDLVISCYSTVSTDLVYLNRIAKTPLAGVVHLLFDSNISRLCAVGGLAKGPWSVVHGFGRGVYDASNLSTALQKAASLSERQLSWEKARALSIPDLPPSIVVVDTILSDLARGCAQ